MEHQQIVALIVIIVGIVFIGTNAYFTGRRDGERRGTVKATLATERALELQQQYEQEKDRREMLTDELTQLGHDQHQVTNSRNKLQAQVEGLTARCTAEASAAASARDDLAITQRTLQALGDEHDHLKVTHTAALQQLDDLDDTVNQQCEQLAALTRENIRAAAALEETVNQLQDAECRALMTVDLEALQHAARQLGQHAASFRRTGSKKINHAEVAASRLQRLIQRAQAANDGSDVPPPELAA